MFSVQCLVFSVQCSVFSVQCSVFSVQRSVFSVQCSVFSVQCLVFSVQCSLHINRLCQMLISIWLPTKDEMTLQHFSCLLSYFMVPGNCKLVSFQIFLKTILSVYRHPKSSFKELINVSSSVDNPVLYILCG